MSKEEPVDLDVPDGVAEADFSVEVLRAWIADGSLLVSINTDAFEDRIGDWGRLLAELAHHVAKASALEGHTSESEALDLLQKTFDRSIGGPKPIAKGQIRGRTQH